MSLKLNKERKGEIANIFILEILKKKRVELNSQAFKRTIGNLAKKTEIPKAELKAFMVEKIEIVVREMLN